MSLKPLISIITVVYNGEKHLEQTINSVINQSYKNIEYIVIDGGSLDGTLEIIKKYDSYISEWISEPDNGLYDAMNKGILRAKGELIGIINSDDWYELDTVKIMVKLYQKNPKCTIFHADRYDIKENGQKEIREFNPSILKFKYYGMTYNHPSMFVHKNEYNWHKYNINLAVMSDYQFVLEAFLKTPLNFKYINTPIVNYRLDGISAKMSVKDSIIEGYRSRKNAGLSYFQNYLSVICRLVVIGGAKIIAEFNIK